MKEGADAVSLDLNPIITNITLKVIMTPTEAIPGHNTGITDNITGVVHNAHTQPLTLIILLMTLHSADHRLQQIMLATSLQTHQESLALIFITFQQITRQNTYQKKLHG